VTGSTTGESIGSTIAVSSGGRVSSSAGVAGVAGAGAKLQAERMRSEASERRMKSFFMLIEVNLVEIVSVLVFKNKFCYFLALKSKEIELTQWRRFLGVKRSPSKTWPRWPRQFAQTISVREPSGSGTLLIAPKISSSKLGQPQPESNLDSEL